ncbi:DUF2892 domain-containing protein [Candidatus Methylopumilus universalis]|jgi:hypothetical protein|uniref:DUF2892 domain-containing protein n=1 Tax=Candidatus Methylopumilus universalis TaxID=2588536 RepID=A0AAX1EXD3_9PROT|nr:DUF2892 domain-containing protein [Candidatus Methylopumilus universalis]MBP6152351.1 DUF2892 domain-containing protein [Candidatus Methylopumilus sp.]MCF8182844.1 DUF2892 domain-containing protein [Limnohabitans sp.]GDX54046.1 hypothetical protein LBMAG28_05200 [Methylophilaceae bacterium]MBP7855718.1 DUF2892 domain-containing protein [Candidatus Methylopumilus sp.]MCF8161939.1 DUF2892 domain-containing protein [Candidatus Methylopumilus sp.]
MKTNVKGLERVVRIAVGAAVLGQAIGGYSVFEYGIVDEVVGVFLLGTGVLASCPLKSVLGLGSKKAPARSPAAKKPAARRKPARKVAAKKPAKRKAAPKRRRAAR